VQDQQRANLASAGISATPDMTPFGQMMAARGLQNSAKVYGAPGGYYDPTNGGSMFGSRGGLMGRSHFESGGDAPYEGDTGPGGLDIPVDQSWREDKKEEDAMAPKPPPSSGGSGASDALGAIKGIAGLATMFLGTGGLAGRRRREDGGELKSDLPGLPPDEGGPPDSVAAPAAPQNSGTPERSWWDNLWGGGDLKYIPPAEQHAPNDDLDPRGPGGAWAPYGAKETPAPLPPPRPAGLVAAQPHERAVATDMPERPHKATGVAPREVQARAEQPRGRQPIMMMAAPEGGEKLQPGYHGDFFENWGRADGGRIYRDDGGALQSDLPGLPEDEGGPPAPKDLVSEPERPNLRDAPLPPVKPAGLVHTGMGNGPFQDVDSEGNVIDNKNLPESPRAPPVRPKTLAQAASAHPNPREFTAETSSAGEGEPIALESFSGIENQPRLKPADIPAKVPEATGVVPPAKVEPVEPVKVEPVKTAPVAPTGVVAPVKAAAPVEPVKTAPVAPTGVVAPVAKTPLDVSVPLGAGVLPPGLHKDASGHFVNDAGGVYDENYYKDGVQYTNKNGVWTRGPEARKEEGKSAQEYADESAAKAQKPEVAAPVAPAGGVVPPESKPVAPEAKTAPAVAPQSAAPASDEAESWRRGIKHVESNGGNYTILGPVITKGMYRGDRAYGAYQMMGRNIPSWSKEALGYSLTPQQLLARPDLQDKIFDFRFARDVKKYGSPQDAASVWFTGHPLSTAGNRSDQLGTTARGYAAKFTQGMNGSFVDQAGRVVRRAGRDLATSAENVGSTVKSGAESLGSAVRGGFDAVGNILGGGGGGGKGQRNFQANAADQGQGGKGGDQNWGQQAGNWFGQNQNWMIPLLTGLGTMASSNSRYLGSAVLQGLGGGAQAYGKQQADQANIQNVAAHTAYTNAQQGNLDQDTANRMIDNQRKAMTSTFGTMGQVYWTRDEKTGAMQPIPVGQYEEMQRKGTAPQFVSPPQVGTANTGASPGVPAVNPPVMGPNGQQVFSGHPVAPGAVAPGGAGAPAPVPAVAGAGTPAPAPAAGAEEKPVGAGAQIETAREARETGAGGAGGAGVGAAAITGRTSGVEAPPPPPAVEIDRQGVNYSGDTSTASHRYNRFDPTQKVYTDQGDADFKKVDQAANDAQTRAGLQQKMMKVSSDVLQNRGWMRTGLGESTRRDIFELINSAPTLWGGGISEKAQKTISDHQLMEKLSTIQAQQQTAGHPTNDMFNAMRQVANPNPSQQGKTVADLVASSIVEDTKNRDKKAFYTKYGSENRGSFYGASDRFAKDNPEGNYSLMKEHLSKLLERHPEKVAEYILHAPKTPKESKAWSDSVFGNHEGRKTKYVPGFGRVFTGE
jgi:hypothetical protein